MGWGFGRGFCRLAGWTRQRGASTTSHQVSGLQQRGHIECRCQILLGAHCRSGRCFLRFALVRIAPPGPGRPQFLGYRVPIWCEWVKQHVLLHATCEDQHRLDPRSALPAAEFSLLIGRLSLRSGELHLGARREQRASLGRERCCSDRTQPSALFCAPRVVFAQRCP